MDTADALFSKP